MNFQTEGRFAFFFFFFNHLFGCFLREAKSPFMLSQGQIQQLTGATDLQGLTDPSFSRAPSHQSVLHSMLASGFRHQLANLSSYRKISSPSFPSLLQFHYNFLPSHSLFSVPLPQLKPPQQSATSTDDLPFPADPGMMEMLIPHPYPPRGDLSCTASIICTSSHPILPLPIPALPPCLPPANSPRDNFSPFPFKYLSTIIASGHTQAVVCPNKTAGGGTGERGRWTEAG